MKAEQRKELETNILADKMGQAMKRVKTRPRRSFFVYLILTVAVLVAATLTYLWITGNRRDNSNRWYMLYDASRENLLAMSQTNGETDAGKAASFQIAWNMFWSEGVKMIGYQSRLPGGERGVDHAMTALEKVGGLYEKLAEDCKTDPIFHPQALLGQAVVEETMALQKIEHLDTAAKYYNELVDKYKDTAEGKFAKGRLDLLNDEKKKAEVADVYNSLRRDLGLLLPAPRGQKNFMPQMPQAGDN